MKKTEKILFFLGLIFLVFIYGRIFLANYPTYRPGFDPEPLKKAFENSQYKGGPGLIPDETLYVYAGWYYWQGGSPILVNPETHPFGKYIIGFFISLLSNARVIGFIFAVLDLGLFFLLAKRLLENNFWAMLTTVILAIEPLFLAQIQYSPLLDNILLFFLLLSFWFFMEKKFFLAAIFLGLTASIKFFLIGFLILVSWFFFLLFEKRSKDLKSLLVVSPLTFLTFLLTYFSVFLEDFSLRRFFGIQKWIFLYHHGRGKMPLVFWDLILFNRWHTWWGDRRLLQAGDWRVLWPISVITALAFIIAWLIKGRQRWSIKPEWGIVFFWIVVYIAFLSLIPVSSRYFLILLPFTYLTMVLAIKKRKKLLSLVLILLVIGHWSLVIPKAYALGYMLPYPSFMPGHKLYRFRLLWEKIQFYWHFGNLAKFKYHLRLSDKYLVEAKTLFEYGQHSLAVEALKKSNSHFQKAPLCLAWAEAEGKDIHQKKTLLVAASEKHHEIFDKLLKELPETIVWQEEKKAAQEIEIKKLLQEAQAIREKN